MWNLSRLRWAGGSCLRRLRRRCQDSVTLLKVTCLSLCYNEFMDKYYIADTAMEPMFWFVDHFTKFFGPFFVFAVCLLTLTVVIIVYIIGVPFWWHKSPVLLAILLVIGHWLLINVVFHYYMAAVTLPGTIPEGILVPDAVSICKKCIAPKPPRTHHCSICNKCILKMDHHCPWLNNCIGHYNHRYFFMYMVYMVGGVLFIMLFGVEIAWIHFFGDEAVSEMDAVYPPNIRNVSKSTWAVSTNASFEMSQLLKSVMHTFLEEHNLPLFDRMRQQYWFHVCLVYMTLLVTAVFMALGTLMMWHARLISRGETSIEAHINKAETKRLQKERKTYHNPYNFGKERNWQYFLGLVEGRTWRHVLLPSRHKPIGDGLSWNYMHRR